MASLSEFLSLPMAANPRRDMPVGMDELGNVVRQVTPKGGAVGRVLAVERKQGQGRIRDYPPKGSGAMLGFGAYPQQENSQ